MPKSKSKTPRYPDDAADIKKILAPLKAMKREAIAEAVGVSASTLSKIVGGQQQLRYQLAKKLLALGQEYPMQGFAEPSSEFHSKADQALRTIPEYACFASPDGAWRIAISAPLRRRRVELSVQNSIEAFAIKAPDNTAAPRYKKGVLIIFARNASPGVGDDAFLFKPDNDSALTGFFGELLRGTETDYRLRQYCNPEQPIEREIHQWSAFASTGVT